jgi:tetratricopeptide (TPR) repeat protein
MPVLAMQLDYMREAEPESVPAMLLRMGRLAWAELGDVDAAIQHYREALQYPGAVDEAAVALADVLEQTGEWAELVALVRQQLDGIEAEEVRLDLSLRGARAAEIELVDLDAAVELYEEARHVAPGHQGATEALYRLLAGGERWFELQDRLEADMRRAEGSQRKIGLALRLAEMALDPEQLGDIDLAANYLNKVLALDPENLNAAEMLVRLYSEQERWQDAASLLGDMLNRVPDIDTQYDLLLRRGDLLLSHLEDSEGASQDYMAAFRLDESRSEAVDRIIVLFTREEAWADLIAVYEFQMRRLSDPGAKAEIAIKIDKLVREKELPREQLYGVLEEAIAANPPYPLNIQLTLKLVGAYVDAGNLQRAKEYVDYGFQVLKEHPDKRRLTSLWYQKGLIEAGLGNYAEAIQAHQECNRLDSAHLLNLIALSKLLYASQQWEEAVKTLQVAMLKQAELTTQQKIDVYYMVGMASRNMGDLNRARQMFRRVLGIDRNHKPSIKALESL